MQKVIITCNTVKNVTILITIGYNQCKTYWDTKMKNENTSKIMHGTKNKWRKG